MNDNKDSIAAGASKFADMDEPLDNDRASSFEVVPKPVERRSVLTVVYPVFRRAARDAHAPVPTQRPPGENFLFRLPDELLVSIVRFAAHRSHFAHNPCGGCYGNIGSSWDPRVIKALSRACRRLRRLAQPLLFHTILFHYPHSIVPPTKPAVQLHHVLKKTPEFRQHCRNLHIHVEDIYPPAPGWYTVARHLARWLTNTRSLYIGGGLCMDKKNKDEDKQTWALLRKILANGQAIEHLRLSSGGFYLVSIFKWVNCSRLKTLEMRLGQSPQGPAKLPPDKRRTAPFSSLTLNRYDERPECIPELLQWPLALTHFDFNHFYDSPHVLSYPMFTNWLLIHRETLTHVSLCTLKESSNHRLFNATLFPNLKFLQLSRWEMASPVQFRIEDADSILGPSLKTFSWAFFVQSAYWHGIPFGEDEISWVRQLVEEAIARKAALKTVEILLPKELYYFNDEDEAERPWEAMFDMRDKVMTPKGITLIYNAPTISEEGWDLEHTRCNDARKEWRAAAIHESEDSPSELEDDQDELDSVWSDGYDGEDIRQYFLPRVELTGNSGT